MPLNGWTNTEGVISGFLNFCWASLDVSGLLCILLHLDNNGIKVLFQESWQT